MSTILITAGADAAAYRIKRLLGQGDEVYLGDHIPLPQGGGASVKLIAIPKGDGASFAHQMLSICLDLNISQVYPLRRNELEPLAEAQLLFAEFGITVVVPDKAMLTGMLSEEPAPKADLFVLLNGHEQTGNAAPVALPEIQNGIVYLAPERNQWQLFAVI